MTKVDEYRQFWITDSDNCDYYVSDTKPETKPGFIHVIEHAAYKDLQQQNDQLKSLFSVQLDIIEHNVKLQARVDELNKFKNDKPKAFAVPKGKFKINGTIQFSDGEGYYIDRECTEKENEFLNKKEIVGEPCEHEPLGLIWSYMSNNSAKDVKSKCKHCDIELKTTWSEKT